MLYFQNCRTYEEARKAYQKYTLRLHPDKGGKEEEFKNMQNQFHNFRAESVKYGDWEHETNKANNAAFAPIIDKLVLIPDIFITIVGSFIWIKGDTKPHKEAIKQAVCDGYKVRWSKGKSMWYFSPANYRKRSKKEFSFDEICDMFGYENVKKKERKQVQ
jgi:hypothetical protein